MEKPPLKQLSTQEWEYLIDDFQSGISSRIDKWSSQYSSSLSLLDLILSSLLRKDFPLKLDLIIFLEEVIELLILESEYESGLGRIIETLRSIVQAPVDGISVTYSLKEQFMISVTSIVISIDGLKNGISHLQGLTELLLTVINRPNHGLDRQTRAVACECLRELEREYPCLLADIAGHLWSLCQSERTHASQSYFLLLTTVVHNLVMSKMNGLIIGTSIPLVPFNVPQSVITRSSSDNTDSSNSNLISISKELRRVMAFLLEHPQILTPCAMMEFMSMIIPIALALDLQPSLLKVQFSGLLYSYDPMLCHIVLELYSRFSDAFDGQEEEIARRLILISKESHHYLVFRLLSLHWLLGFINPNSSKRETTKKNSVVDMSSSFYPTVFDPLALKAMKLDMLACCATLKPEGVSSEKVDDEASVVKLLEDGLVSVSSFKWLPPWSSETAVAFRTLHKFLIGATPHSASDDSTIEALMESTIFRALQKKLVDMALEHKGLVPIIVAFLDRLLGCPSHCWLGERLLQTFDEHLLPKVVIDYRLASYFPIFNRIAANYTIPPRGLLELLTQFLVTLVEKHGPDTELNSWSLGNKVLCICRTMLMRHHSSRIFLILTRLLTFTCLYFPDLEIRDNARNYLRMLLCIPGKKLRCILNLEEQPPGISPSSHLFQSQSPRVSQDLEKSRNISSYIHIERMIPLLVKQTWSLALSTLDVGSEKVSILEGIKDTEPHVDNETEVISNFEARVVLETDRVDMQQEPLRVTDSKVSQILEILRLYFSCIPDFRHMPGLKIRIPCSLRFEADRFNCIWGVDLPASNSVGMDTLPAIYATVLTFTSSASYGSIPSFHIPFLLGETKVDDYNSNPSNSLVTLPLENHSDVDESSRAPVTIELEPREPMPGLIDVAIEANAENGQIVRGQLMSVTVGIEDMFLKASIPSNVPEYAVTEYYSDLFNALWEACGSSSSTGRETFPLRGGKGVAAISGTRSVKLLEVPENLVIRAVECHLAPYIVSVAGEPLINAVRDGGIIVDVIWNEEGLYSPTDKNSEVNNFDFSPLQLKYIDNDEDEDDEYDREYDIDVKKRNLGCFLVLIFLPPRFHLLMQMEVSDISTLVRIRTDHWPCLAYIDDYLEALFLK